MRDMMGPGTGYILLLIGRSRYVQGTGWQELLGLRLQIWNWNGQTLTNQNPRVVQRRHYGSRGSRAENHTSFTKGIGENR